MSIALFPTSSWMGFMSVIPQSGGKIQLSTLVPVPRLSPRAGSALKDCATPRSGRNEG